MSNKKNPMSCLLLVGIFILVIMLGFAVLINFEQQNGDVKQSAPEPNWQRKTPENIRLERTHEPHVSTIPVYSPADFPIEGIKIWDTISIKGIVSNVRITHAGEVIFGLEDKGRHIIFIASKNNPEYQNGKLVVLTGKYLTSKTN